MKNFKECKEIFIKFSNKEITQAEFDKWSKEHCDKCFFIKGGHCLFGKKNKNDK